ncbi:D-arabinono-1,4-lactone oxidase [Paenibacillus oryzisoli]|uniref:FAD-binding oxidoreductase n=1 Tax=Paenibacillus oryzisoli TaxID=1850517 RepID=A0A198ACK1_9BACL|nr:D-arabinono-1,4-lactone oxidase [Paenibacillus oryzisoli]OAS18897.1 FAD-binding oxidoreductase [Paenibacillus oryzisoli]
MMGKSGTWTNWSGIVQASPQTVLYPESIEAVVDAVRLCRREGRRLRVVGTGHSFTPIAASDDVLISLDHMQGLIEVDVEELTATVWAGTKLKLLGELLFLHGLAQENLGDIDVQSIAGAISTGTHGTGQQFGNIATQVVGVTMVTGAGEVITCTHATHPDLFKAMQISIGALGIIVQVTLRLQTAYKMMYESKRMPLKQCLQELPDIARGHRHFEFYWFPYADPCQLKFMNPTDRAVTSRKVREYVGDVLIENTVFGLLSELCRKVPKLSRMVSRISASQVPVGSKVDYSHRLFATQRLVRFNEMEYNLPAEAMPTVIEEMREKMVKDGYNVHFPIECRYAKGDDIWLSPAFGRDSSYIAIHMYKGMPHEGYFAGMEDIFLKHGGRPHWGKMHSLRSADLAERYPMWQAFCRSREELDPDGIMRNGYLDQIFGVTG